MAISWCLLRPVYSLMPLRVQSLPTMAWTTYALLEPVKIGDTIQVELTCKQKTPKALRDPVQKPHGVVVWDIKVKNQRDELVATYDILTTVERG